MRPPVSKIIDFETQRMAMVDCQIRPSDVTRLSVIAAMMEIPREEFAPEDLRAVAYAGEHLRLGSGRVVLDPRVFAKMLDGLDIQPDELVLDIGPAYGYSSAVISRLAEAVVAIEPDPDMAAEAVQRLHGVSADNVALLDGELAKGSPAHGPYDVITIQGGVQQIPAPLKNQLKEGGKIGAVFVNAKLGACMTGVKVNGQIDWSFAFNASAPLLPGFEKTPEFVF